MVDYRREVNATFVSRHGDGKNFSNTQRLNLLHSVAKAMLSGEYSCHISELEKRMKTHHDAEVKKWNLTLEGIKLADDIEQYIFCFRFQTSLTYVSSQQGFETPSLMPYTPFFRRSAPTLAAMSVSSQEMPQRMMLMKDFSLCEYSRLPWSYLFVNTLEKCSLVAWRSFLNKELDTVGRRWI